MRQVKAFDPEIAAYAEYALNAQGKQLRPALVALTANALGRPNESHVKVAVIIEMVHLATLVHDDVMDEAEIRRNRPTLASNWGNDIAVLLGDCLFARALVLAAEFPTPEICRAVASATGIVCAGEILQTHNHGDFGFSREKYFKVLQMKTAELFALSTELAAQLAGATPTQCAKLRQFGLDFGTAYQIYDDCVDLFGSEAVAGKSLGTDLMKGKLTLPVLLLWERITSPEQERLEKMIAGWKPSFMPRLAKLLAKHGAFDASISVLEQFLTRARQSVATLPASPGRSQLMGLTDYLARQVETLGAPPENGL